MSQLPVFLLRVMSPSTHAGSLLEPYLDQETGRTRDIRPLHFLVSVSATIPIQRHDPNVPVKGRLKEYRTENFSF